MSIIQQIRGDQLPAQSSGIPAGLQISPTGNSEFGKYLPSESAVQSPDKVASGLGMNPLPPDVASSDANRSIRFAHDSPPPDLSGGVGVKSPIQMNLIYNSPPPNLSEGVGVTSPIQIDSFHSMQPARAYALNSIMDVLDRGAFGTIV